MKENKRVWEKLYCEYGDKVEVINELKHLRESISRVEDADLNSSNYHDILKAISLLSRHLDSEGTCNLSDSDVEMNANAI